jgi:hypothetical protein
LAQCRYLLSIGPVAAPDSSPAPLVVIVAAAILLAERSFALLYALQQRQFK